MAKNKFDEEKIPTVDCCDAPSSFDLWDDETAYDVREKRGIWWQCPKCGGNITFESMDEGFDEDLGENQFFTVYTWKCKDCGAVGSVHAVVNPQYISIVQEDDDD